MSFDKPLEQNSASVARSLEKPAADNSKERWQRAGFLIAALITVWIAVLHVLFLFNAGPLWRDEAGTVGFAAMPSLGDIWRNLRYDNFPPLFVGVARVWTLAGLNSDFSYRVLGFLIGMGTLGVLWLCAQKLGAKTPLFALALYAANPVAIRVGDSLRPYGLGIALTLLTLMLIWDFVRAPGKKAFFLAILAATLSVQCLYQNVFFIFAFCCGAWVVTLSRKEWKTSWQTGIIGLVAAVSLLPYCVIYKKCLEWNDIARREIHFDAIWNSLRGALRAPGEWMAPVWLALLAAGLAVVVRYGILQRRWDMVYYGTVLVVSTTLYLTFLRVAELPPRSWYFLILMAPTALLMDVIFGGLNTCRLQIGRAILSLILIAACVPACYASVQFRQSNIDLVAAKLKESAEPEDLIIVLPWHYGVSLQRYLDFKRWTTIPPMEDTRIHRYDLMKKAMMTENPIGPLLDKVRTTLRSGHRLWLVGTAQAPPGGNPQPVYPPYNADRKLTEDMYFSSWMFQITYLLQEHAAGGNPVSIPVPDGQPVNPLENVPLVVIHGWRE